MLGNYEDVDTPSPLSIEMIPTPAYANLSQSDQGQLNTDKSTKPPIQNQVLSMSTQSQKEPSSNSLHPMRGVTTTSPTHHGHSSTFSKPPLNHSQGSQLNHSAHHQQQQKKNEVFSDLRDRASLYHEMSDQSDDVKPLPFLHSSDHNHMDTDTKDTVDEYQGSTDHASESSSNVDVSILKIKQSPKDVSLPEANKTNALPSQTFPLLLSSKQPSVVMTQKPTAYVRPMDGQDQLVTESPELKPSPEPYAPLPELIGKSDLGKTKKAPQFLETKTDEAQCVEDILREMAHAWPPLLKTICTPSTDEPPKSPFLAKEAKHASSCPGQRNHDSSPPESSHPSQQMPSSSFEGAHSSGVESMSSSESESSSGSDSESENSTVEPPQPPAGTSIKTAADAPAVSHEDWQLGNWIRSSQPNSGSESQSAVLVPENTSHKEQQFTQDFKHSSVQVVDSTGESQPQLSSHHTDSTAVSQQSSESSQDNCCLQSRQKSLSANVNSSKKFSKSVKGGCPDRTDAATPVKCEEAVTAQTKYPCFTDRPKVKTKVGHCKKSKEGSNGKRDIKRTKLSSQHFPNSCPAQSPVQPAPPVSISCSKSNTETISQTGTKMPHKTTHKHLKKPGRIAKASLDLERTPRSLMVKIELSLLSRVPQTSGIHQGIPSTAKQSAPVTDPDKVGGGTSATHSHTKTSRKSKPQNAEVDNKGLPRKKQKLENKNASLTKVSVKLKCSSSLAEAQQRKKAKKDCQHPEPSEDAAKKSKLHKSQVKTQESSKKTEKKKVSHKHKKSNGKSTEHPKSETSDKLSKAFNYLDAAMFFVESGIAMEKDPQTLLSSYTMFAETVELLKFVLKLKNSVDLSAPPPEKDFLVLCLKCQSLLQMAMFRHKHKAALKYSKTLTEHFSSSAQATHNPQTSRVGDNLSTCLPSPATTSGPSSNHSASGLVVGSTVAVPQAIEQMTFTYVNITSLFLSAHDIWEQAEELARKGSGMLAELDTVMGPLNLSSDMTSMVRYTRQGVYWLRLDSQKV
uniref:AF4/FMR2 C-terminal homology domain-containing protein n=1 Tax=Astatotilapia calliptera TaxID=8154 RepID=A0AAX7V8E4_ASTCA